MPSPRLIHPVKVEYRSLNTSKSKFDPDGREPIQQPYYDAAVVLFGQIRHVDFEEMRMTTAGDAARSTTEILILQKELSRKGIAPKKNDRITKIGSRVVNLHVEEVLPAIHYQDAQAVALTTVDRAPFR